MPELPGKHVIRRRGEDRVLSSVSTAPNFSDNVLSELGLKKLHDFETSDKVEGVSMLEVLVEKQVANFLFLLDFD